MDKRETIKRRYELATNPQVAEALKELLFFVVEASTSSLTADKLQGMLILLNEPNNWISAYKRELEKSKRETN